MDLQSLGWDFFFEESFQPHRVAGLLPARVAVENGILYTLIGEDGGITARCSGRFLHHISARAEMPAVGDWVACARRAETDQVDIQAVLPRRTRFSRSAAGTDTSEQVVAANIDTLFLVTGLDHNFNLRRIERYLAVANESGADPVIILNKTDLCPETDERLAEVEAIARGAPVIAVSAANGLAIDEVKSLIQPGKTVALLGSSGVGKSTLANQLLGQEIQDTGSARITDGRGRHTTTTRNLIPIPSGGMLIDTPGMRELGLWDTGTGVRDTFEDIGELATRCHFNNCQHGNEPHCAIRGALESGELDPGRFQNWLKLQREESFVQRQQDEALRRKHTSDWKRITTDYRRKTRFEENHLGD